MKLRSIFLGVLLLQCAVFAQFFGECPPFSDPNDYIDDPNALDNGLFECGDPNLTEYDFEPPLFWERVPTPVTAADCHAALHASFDPPEPRVDWDIASPYQGESFVVLSTGNPDGSQYNDGLIEEACISQKVLLEEGDVILGAFFFGTNDYMPYNDYGKIKLKLVGDPNDHPGSVGSFDIPGSYCDVSIVGSWRSTDPEQHPEVDLSVTTDGWVPFMHTVEPNQVGPYLLKCEVVDFGDAIINSYYAVDGLRICRGGKPLSDLNNDCNVNLIDYSILSEAWLAFCPNPPIGDPNFPGDPNDYPAPPADPNILEICESADFDSSWFVDPNDLVIMSDQWLFDTSSE